MIVVKTWCLPADQSEDDLNRLFQAIMKAVISVSELGVKDENNMVCLFPADLMKYGLGEEIIVEIDGLPFMLQNELTICEQLAEKVATSVANLYRGAKVQCSARRSDPLCNVWLSTHK